MDVASWTVLALLAAAVLVAVLLDVDPEVRRHYDRWGTGHGRWSGSARGWFGSDDHPDGTGR